MNNTPCRVSADLRRYELEHDGDGEHLKRIDEIARDMACELIEDGKRLSNLVSDYEIDIFVQLARAFRHLDKACGGDRIATTACLCALAHLQRMTFAEALKEVAYVAEQKVQP
jgi:hypothetical protein